MKVNKLIAILSLMFVGLAHAKLSLANETENAGLVQDCKGISVELNSLKRTGRGDITAELSLLNNKNDDMATFAYYGGANGHNTYLIDSSGGEWKKKRGGDGNRRFPLIAGIKSKYKLLFHIESGGDDVDNFTLIYAPQILPHTGMGTFGFCTLKFPNISIQQ